MSSRPAIHRVLAALLVLAIQAPGPAEPGSPGKAAARAAIRRLAEPAPVYKRPWGPVRTFRKEERLERFTNRPATDRSRGLPPHSFWIRHRAGRHGSATYVQRKHNIPHTVSRREETVVQPGMKYHERPIKGGRRHAREVILHERLPGKAVGVKEFVRRSR